MANEAVIVELLGKVPGRPIRYTIASATAAEKGTLMKITNPRTAVVTAADNDAFAGILAIEKEANQETSCTCYTHGIFDLVNTADADLTAGQRVSIKAANSISAVAAADLLFSDVGILMEDTLKSATGAVLVGSLF